MPQLSRITSLISTVKAELETPIGAPLDVKAFVHAAHECTAGRPYDADLLPPFWTPVNPHPKQAQRWASDSRFTVSCAGRRTNKTQYAIRKAVMRALSYHGLPGRVLLGAPTLGQARDIWWSRLKQAVPHRAIIYLNESRGQMDLWNGVTFRLMGNENRKRSEGGLPVLGACLDEFADVDFEMWSASLRPMLMDTNGWAELLGKPIGRNHYYKVALEAQADLTGEWTYHHWTAEEVLPYYLGAEKAAREIASIKAGTDDYTYKTEYLARWEEPGGLAYYCFARSDEHVQYDPALPANLCFDFNISPGIAIVVQERSGIDWVVDEVWLERDSNTQRVCEALKSKLTTRPVQTFLYGDPAGGAGGSAKLLGSDWDIIDRELAEFRPGNCVLHSAPAERARVNAMNTRLRTTDDTRRFHVSKHCVRTIEDFESVKVHSSGQLAKRDDPMHSHITDALGYYIVAKYGLVGGAAGSMAA